MTSVPEQRYERSEASRPPYIIGITGEIGTGKTTVAQMASELAIPNHNADLAASEAMAENQELQKKLKDAFPECFSNNKLSRESLASYVFEHPEALEVLNALVHPDVFKRQNAFIKHHEKMKTPFIILDVPLLFETKNHRKCHFVILTTCTPEIQKKRVLSRPHMSEKRFYEIKHVQWPFEKKRTMCDAVLETSCHEKKIQEAFENILQRLGSVNVTL